MPTNEEGEFELVLGNRQLLSVFFIVVLLLGVFFTMGYIVGRNTMPAGSQLASAKNSQPLVVEPPGSSTPPPVEPPDTGRPSPTGAAAPPADESPKQQTPPVSTQPAVSAPPRSDPPKTTAKSEPPKPATAKPEPPKPEPPKAADQAGDAGQYLQVAATRKSEADLLAEVLTKKGYATVVAPVPDAALFRVLVGPLRDADMPKTREALTAAGFKPFPRKL